MEKIRILVVEDESITAKDIQKTLRNLGYDVSSVVSSGEAAIQKVQENKPDLALMDIVLKGRMDGIQAAEQIRSRFNIPVVYLTAYADDKIVERAKLTEPFGYIAKPFEDRELKNTVEMAIYKAKIERKAKQAVKEWEVTFDSISDLVSIHDKDFKLVRVNKAFADAFKAKPEELIGKYCHEVVHGLKGPHPYCACKELLENKIATTVDFFEANMGVDVEISASPVFDDKGDVMAMVHITKDISERKRAERQIEASLKEKEMLLREIHHRVKNNIQVIVSLLRLHSQTIEDKESINVFKECQERIKAMALVHENFCQSKGSLNIDFKEYIKKLADNLVGSYNTNGDRITLKIDVEDVSVEIGLATYCGLILTQIERFWRDMSFGYGLLPPLRCTEA